MGCELCIPSRSSTTKGTSVETKSSRGRHGKRDEAFHSVATEGAGDVRRDKGGDLCSLSGAPYADGGVRISLPVFITPPPDSDRIMKSLRRKHAALRRKVAVPKAKPAAEVIPVRTEAALSTAPMATPSPTVRVTDKPASTSIAPRPTPRTAPAHTSFDSQLGAALYTSDISEGFGQLSDFCQIPPYASSEGQARAGAVSTAAPDFHHPVFSRANTLTNSSTCMTDYAGSLTNPTTSSGCRDATPRVPLFRGGGIYVGLSPAGRQRYSEEEGWASSIDGSDQRGMEAHSSQTGEEAARVSFLGIYRNMAPSRNPMQGPAQGGRAEAPHRSQFTVNHTEECDYSISRYSEAISPPPSHGLAARCGANVSVAQLQSSSECQGCTTEGISAKSAASATAASGSVPDEAMGESVTRQAIWIDTAPAQRQLPIHDPSVNPWRSSNRVLRISAGEELSTML